MARVLVSVPAKQDVRDILTHLNDRAGYRVANRYAADFKRAYRILAEFPESGSRRPALGPDARVKLVHPYLVIYDYLLDDVTVLRILHAHREITMASLARSRRVAPSAGG